MYAGTLKRSASVFLRLKYTKKSEDMIFDMSDSKQERGVGFKEARRI